MLDPKDQIQPNSVSPEIIPPVSPEPFGEYVQPAGEIRQVSIPPDVSGHVIPVVVKIPDDVQDLGVSSSTNPSIRTFSGVKLKDSSPDTGLAWMKESSIYQEDIREAA